MRYVEHGFRFYGSEIRFRCPLDPLLSWLVENQYIFVLIPERMLSSL